MTNTVTNVIATFVCTMTNFLWLQGNTMNPGGSNLLLYQPMVSPAIRVETKVRRVIEYTITNYYEIGPRASNGPPVWRPPDGPPPLPVYPGFYPSKQ